MALSACGGTNWQKPDATSSQLHGDRDDCKVNAEQADDGDVVEDCMKGRGGSKTEPTELPN